MPKTHIQSGGRYPVLRALAILFLIGALFALLSGVYWIYWICAELPGTPGEKFNWSLLALAGTFFSIIVLLAMAELSKLLIDIEHNTRLAAKGAGADVGLGEESAEAALIRGH